MKTNGLKSVGRALGECAGGGGGGDLTLTGSPALEAASSVSWETFPLFVSVLLASRRNADLCWLCGLSLEPR